MKDWLPRLIILLLIVLTVALPLWWSNTHAAPPADADLPRLVIVSPHNEQIRYEFSVAFARWHKRMHGTEAVIDWRSLGGTSDIRKMLLSRYTKLAEAGRADEGAGFDMMFGGGEYEFDHQLKPGVSVPRRDPAGNIVKSPDGKPVMRQVSLTVPVEIPQSLIAAAFPTADIAGEKLYDVEGHWYGVVLSSFGIAYNHDVLERLGLEAPTTWADLADPRYDRWLALADPAHSGSVRVTYDAILQRYGFDNAEDTDAYGEGFLRRSGIKTLRRVFANARYFAPGSNKVPTDVSHGEAAAGICIDFYGRYQSQVIGGGRRVGFVAPAGATLISADPIAVLRGATNKPLAIEFIKFLLTPEGQAAWCFQQGLKIDTDRHGPLHGPRRFELRRSPIRRDMYEHYREHVTDPVNPYDIASPLPPGTPSWFSPLPTILHAMCMDIHADLQAAWRAVYRCDNPALKARLRREFDALPPIDARRLLAAYDAAPQRVQAKVESRHGEALAAARRAIESGNGAIRFELGLFAQRELLWKADPRNQVEDRIAWTAFFREQYAKVVALAAGR